MIIKKLNDNLDISREIFFIIKGVMQFRGTEERFPSNQKIRGYFPETLDKKNEEGIKVIIFSSIWNLKGKGSGKFFLSFPKNLPPRFIQRKVGSLKNSTGGSTRARKNRKVLELYPLPHPWCDYVRNITWKLLMCRH